MAPTDPRTVVDPIVVGTSLRDAAVSPVAGDFLPPINAGAAGELGNPHGPTVVSPGIHGVQGVRPILAGPVSDDNDVQEAAEVAHTKAWQPDTYGIASIALTGTQTTTVGGTTQLTATSTNVSGTTANVSATATWKSSNPAKATVSATGLVTGVQAGTTDITATFGGVESVKRTITVS